jgi:hypothetical protein
MTGDSGEDDPLQAALTASDTQLRRIDALRRQLRRLLDSDESARQIATALRKMLRD